MAEPLVLIPGLSTDARVFDPQLRAFNRERAMTLALPTVGERMEEVASELLSQLPQKFALAGVAFGGCVAMEIMRRAPERVQRIALISTSPLAETPQQAADREPLLVKLRSGRIEDALRDLIRPEHLAPGPDRIGVVNRLVEMGRDLGPEVLERQIRCLQRRKDQQATLRKVRVPALVLCGRQDGLIPVKRFEFMAELIHHAKFEIIEDAGHHPFLETPEAMTEALRRWLKQPYVLR